MCFILRRICFGFKHWGNAKQSLGPIETTMLIALPEFDGAICPTVFAGQHSSEGCQGCLHKCQAARLRQKRNHDKSVAIVLFEFPPNAGATGTAVYLDVFESLQNTLTQMKADGYDVALLETVAHLRAAVLEGNAKQYGQEASVEAIVGAEKIVRSTPSLIAIEVVWDPAPGRVQSDGRAAWKSVCWCVARLSL